MNIESKPIIIEQHINSAFNLFDNVAVFEQLMPKDIHGFKITDNQEFTFKFSASLPEITLQKSQESFPNILYKNKGGNIPFSMKILLNEINLAQTEVRLSLNSDINGIMAMMIKPIAEKFINTLSENAKML